MTDAPDPEDVAYAVASSGASGDLPADVLDAAPFILVLRYDGTVYTSVAHEVDDDTLAAYLHTVADLIAAGEHRAACETCAAGLPHTPDDGVPSAHDEDPTRP